MSITSAVGNINSLLNQYESIPTGKNVSSASASDDSEYVNSSDLQSMEQSISDSENSLFSIGITVNSDGTLSINQDTLKSALSDDASNVASVLNGVASDTKSSASSLVSNALANYTSSFKETISMYRELDKYEAESTLIGQLFNTTA